VLVKKLGLGIATLSMAVILTAAGFFRVDQSANTRVFSHTTRPVVVDDIYPSMFGPTDQRSDLKLYNGSPELVWITGYGATMIDSNGSQKSQEFMCHDTLSLHSIEGREQVFGSLQSRQKRLFTLSQGQEKIQFPAGFGIPMSANENLMLQSQVLNLREEGIGETVSHKVETEYIADTETSKPMKALAMVSGGIDVDVLDPQADEPPESLLSCAPDAGGQQTFKRGDKEVTAHWVVRPGYEKRESSLGRLIPMDSTAHYISVHMHNFGKSLELYDVTAGETVFKSLCTPTTDGYGLAATTCYSSEKGVKVYRDHEYKLISEYDNTSDQDQTAMAFIFVYFHNPDFVKPGPEDLRKLSVVDELCAPEEQK
jgi:hypothetical protein